MRFRVKGEGINMLINRGEGMGTIVLINNYYKGGYGNKPCPHEGESLRKCAGKSII